MTTGALPVPALFDPGPTICRGVTLFRRHGLTAGDRVALLLPNTPHTFGLLAAACLEGIVAVPLPPDLGVAERQEILDDADPTLVLADPDATPRADLPGRVVAVTPADIGALPGTDPSSDWPRTRPMAYTSGTTGRRKGVYVGVHDASWGQAMVADEHDAFERRHGDRHLVVSPLYHSGPFRFALVTALTGGRVAVLPRFDPVLFRETVRQQRITSLFCVPTHLHRLLAHAQPGRDDLASLTLLAHAGAPCPVPLKERVIAIAPEDSVWEFYGSTEGQFTVCPPSLWQQAPGTLGRARPGRQMEIRGDDGRPLPAGEVGTVWARVPEHARFAYWRDPARTAEVWDGDAFTVGDLGHVDPEQRLYLDGRPGDLVITGGVNVYPAEVERQLLAHPDVAEAVVYGAPDDDWGERLLAAVVPWPGRHPDGPDLRAWLAERLARAKVPKEVRVVADLPRTATGKVRRSALTSGDDRWPRPETTSGDPQ